jgi:hypothetical protein
MISYHQQTLEESVSNFYKITKSGTEQEFILAAKRAGQDALTLIEQGEALIAVEKDPIKKVNQSIKVFKPTFFFFLQALLKDALLELREASAVPFFST